MIETESAIDPIAARRVVFKKSGGFITSKNRWEKVLNRAARRRSIVPEELERALWADQEDNLAVKEFRTLAPEELLCAFLRLERSNAKNSCAY